MSQGQIGTEKVSRLHPEVPSIGSKLCPRVSNDENRSQKFSPKSSVTCQNKAEIVFSMLDRSALRAEKVI
jgi:hypothetical protein